MGGDPLLGGQTDVIAGLLLEVGQNLVLSLARDVQTKDEPGLDALEVEAVPLAGKAQRAHIALELLVRVEHVRVDLHEIAPALLGHLGRSVEQLAHHSGVPDVAHRAAGGVHEGEAAGHASDENGQGAPDGVAFVPGQHAPPVPLGLGGGPVGGLQEMALGMGGDKGLHVGAALAVGLGNDLIHGYHLNVKSNIPAMGVGEEHVHLSGDHVAGLQLRA